MALASEFQHTANTGSAVTAFVSFFFSFLFFNTLKKNFHWLPESVVGVAFGFVVFFLLAVG